MFRKLSSAIRQWKTDRLFKRIQRDWHTMEKLLIVANAPRHYRRQLRRDLIKGVSHFFDERLEK